MPTMEMTSIIIVIMVTMKVRIALLNFPTLRFCHRITEGSGPSMTSGHFPLKLSTSRYHQLTICACAFSSIPACTN